MTGREIIGRLAAEGRVEGIIRRIAGTDSLDADLEDLAQMVYVTLCEQDEGKLAGLWERGETDYFIVRLVISQLRSRTSRYYYAIRLFQSRSRDLGAIEYKTSSEGP